MDTCLSLTTLCSIIFSLIFLIFLDVLECGSMPCMNGGQCVEGTGRYTCQCAAGYTGLMCETSKLQRVYNRSA